MSEHGTCARCLQPASVPYYSTQYIQYRNVRCARIKVARTPDNCCCCYTVACFCDVNSIMHRALQTGKAHFACLPIQATRTCRLGLRKHCRCDSRVLRPPFYTMQDATIFQLSLQSCVRLCEMAFQFVPLLSFSTIARLHNSFALLNKSRHCDCKDWLFTLDFAHTVWSSFRNH